MMEKLLLRIFATAVMMYLFSLMHWINLGSQLPSWATLLLIAVVCWGLNRLMYLAIPILGCVSCGCLVPLLFLMSFVINWLSLIWGAYLTGLYTVDVGFWYQGLLISLVMAAVNGYYNLSANTSHSNQE